MPRGDAFLDIIVAGGTLVDFLGRNADCQASSESSSSYYDRPAGDEEAECGACRKRITQVGRQ